MTAYLQIFDINLLTAVQLVGSLKMTPKTMRNTESNYDNTYKKVFKLCKNNQIVISPVKKRKFLNKVDCFSNTCERVHYLLYTFILDLTIDFFLSKYMYKKIISSIKIILYKSLPFS